MNKKNQKSKRQLRIRSKVKGTKEKPRLSVFRANRYIYAQIINDEEGKTLLTVFEKHIGKDSLKDKKTERAKKVGVFLAKKAIEKKITKVVFDRSGYAYHGRVRALAEGAREGGLKF